jgi:hypothetical protein
MNTNGMFAKFGLFMGAAFFITGFIVIKPVLAQVDASSSLPSATSSITTDPKSTGAISTTSDPTTAPIPDASTASVSDASTESAATASTSDASDSHPVSPVSQSTSDTAVTPTEAPPEGLTLVHIIGEKYIDYFTDGTNTVSFPGDPDVDANLNKPNAPIPTHEGLTWDHTAGGYLYDTLEW